jgi:hypothetical protein
MKILLVILINLINICCSYSTQAQESDSSTFVRDRSFDFYFVDGYALGYKLNINERSAMKLVLDFKGTYLNRDRWQNDDPSEYSEKRDNINLAFCGAYCYSLYKNTYVDICIGFGPYYNLNFSSNTGTEFVKDTLSTNVRHYHSDSYNAFGALTLFGVEGFISTHISLIAEAQLTGSYRWEKSYSEAQEIVRGMKLFNMLVKQRQTVGL